MNFHVASRGGGQSHANSPLLTGSFRCIIEHTLIANLLDVLMVKE